jgi:hypothetical protein
MKKTMIVLVFAWASCNSNAFEDLQSTPIDSYECVNNTCFVEPTCQARFGQRIDEYKQGEKEIVMVVESDEVDDYEQAISNSVQPPKISAAQQMLARVFGELLVRYIGMREITRIYFQELKATVNNWYHNYITSA